MINLTKIKRIMERRKMTLRQLAENSGLPYGTVSDIYVGKTKNPTLATMVGLSIGLKTNIAQLIRTARKS